LAVLGELNGLFYVNQWDKVSKGEANMKTGDERWEVGEQY
jgi:hypothetical protein